MHNKANASINNAIAHWRHTLLLRVDQHTLLSLGESNQYSDVGDEVSGSTGTSLEYGRG